MESKKSRIIHSLCELLSTRYSIPVNTRAMYLIKGHELENFARCLIVNELYSRFEDVNRSTRARRQFVISTIQSFHALLRELAQCA